MRHMACKFLAMAVLTASLSAASVAQSIKTFIDFPSAPLDLAVNPATNKVYVIVSALADESSDSLAVIDGSSDTLLQSIPVPAGSQAVTVDYVSNRIYVAGCDPTVNPSPCTIAVINGKTNAVVNTIPVTMTPGLGLTGITVNPLTQLLYVANANDNVINIVCERRLKLVGSIDLQGNSPSAIAINPLLNRLYVPFGTNLTAVVDAGKKQILSETHFGSDTVGVAANLVSGHVFVTDDESGPSATEVLDKNGAVVASVAVDDSPSGVDVDPFTNLTFVASPAVDSVTVIDGTTNTVRAHLSGVPANFVAVNPATQKVYVSGNTGVTVLTEK